MTTEQNPNSQSSYVDNQASAQTDSQNNQGAHASAQGDGLTHASNLSYWAVKHPAIILFLMIASIIGGILSYQMLGRSEDPQFEVPAMSIIMVWPGATAEEIQNQVMNKVENRLQEVDDYKEITTFSRQGYGGINLVMRGGLPAERLHDLWYQVRKKIGDIEDLPEGVLPPIFNDEFSDIYSVMYAVTAKDLSMAELELQADALKKGLQEVPYANKVHIYGVQQQHIYVEFSSQKLASQRIPPLAILDALKKENTITPAGSYQTDADNVYVRVADRFKTVQDVANTRINVAGNMLRLGDIARVYKDYEWPANYITRFNGEQAVVVAVTMQKGANVLTFSDNINAQMDMLKKDVPLGVSVDKFTDQPTVVKESIGQFFKVFFEALAIVLIISFISLGMRTGLVVAISIPLVLAIVTIIMAISGWDLNRVTLGALIISLGLLVDDAIIAVEMMLTKMEQGFDRIRAASFAYTSTAFPMLTGTLITVAGFMPVGFAKSNAGQYAGGIFWVVGIALVVSWFVAVLFIPYLGVRLLPNVDAAKHQHSNPYDKPSYHRFERLLHGVVKHRKLVLAGTAALFVLSILGMKLVQQQFFPTASRPELHVTLQLKQGASIEATNQKVEQLEAHLRGNEHIKFFSTYVGKSSPRYFLSSMPELPNAGYAQVVIMTKGVDDREVLRADLQELFKTDARFADAIGRVSRLEFGPPVKYPVSFRVLGNDPAKVRQIAYDVQAVMHQNKLVRDVLLEWNEQVRALNIDIDEDKAAQLGITKQDIATTVQAVVSGIPASFIPQGDRQIDITLRANPDERESLARLSQIMLFSNTGAAVPLSQVASISQDFEEPVLWRINRQTQLSVSADVADGVQAPFASAQIENQLADIKAKLPVGYEIETAGAIKESNESNAALAGVAPIMLIVILFLLMIQLQSFSKMFMVFLTAPLGLIGVVPALLLTGSPFGFVALIGVIALAGMVMRNSVILVDQIAQDIDEGIPVYEAIIGSTIRRARPVLLTAFAAILGMVPLSTSVFWGPMAIGIMGGLLVGTLLTLVFVPALYAAWFRVQQPKRLPDIIAQTEV